MLLGSVLIVLRGSDEVQREAGAAVEKRLQGIHDGLRESLGQRKKEHEA